jgi:hypothetical protein
MAGIPVTNFGKVTVSIGYDAAATSIVLSSGHGSRLPSTFPYPLSWWNATDYSDPADDPNREIITVTNRASDTLTITRASEGTSASTKNTGSKTYKMVLSLTKAMYDALFTLSLTQSFRGLTVQTHPDSDKALSQVRFSADSIVMDDGQEIKGWSNIDVALTASGLNGIDTGAEAASVGYELWAIYNGTTKAGVLHRAKDYFLDEDITAGEDASQGLRSAVDNSTVRIAQGFQVSTAGPLEFVDVKLIKTGTPTGNYWFTIEANSGGVPSNTPLATSDKYDVSRLTTTAGVVRLPFRTPATISASTQYHLVMYGDYTVSATNFASWRMDGSAASYANGSKALFDSDTSTWTSDTDDDMYAKIYITRNDTAVTMPSGYTQKAKISPWAYNNASSNLMEFWQRDRTTFTGNGTNWKIGNFSAVAGAGNLVDTRAFLPPVPLMVVLEAYSAASALLWVGGLNVTDPVSTGTGASAYKGAAAMTNITAWVNCIAEIALEYNGFTFNAQASTHDLYVSTFRW